MQRESGCLPKRLLILHDSPHFGGHEIIFFKIFPAILGSCQISEIAFCHYEGNAKLAAALEGFKSDKLKIFPVKYRKRRGEPYLAPFRRSYARTVSGIEKAFRPDMALLVQGRIENLCVPMIALSSELRLCSYLPMAHLQKEIARYGMMGDHVRRQYYSRPDQFIVPSKSVAEQVISAGGIGDIAIADNVVDAPLWFDKSEAMKRCGISGGKKVALFLGRLDREQKGLDILGAAIGRASEQLSGWQFVFVGDGPGISYIERLKANVSCAIQVVPWTASPQDFLAAADVLLMPSRWEGVPLVMLEAIGCGLPILASDIDVFREYLPRSNCIDFRETDLACALEAVAEPNAARRFAEYCSARGSTASLADAQHAFLAALIGGSK